jgi:hypothetical protein
VATQQATGVTSQVYQVWGNFGTFETFEEPGRLTYFLTGGDLRIGMGNAIASVGLIIESQMDRWFSHLDKLLLYF